MSYAAPPASNTLIADAGLTEINGTYTPRGIANGKTYYNLTGQPDNAAFSAIAWDGVQWSITTNHGDVVYFDDEDVVHPWDGTNWQDNAVPPAPTVTESP